MTIKLSDIEQRLAEATSGPWYAVADATVVSRDPDTGRCLPYRDICNLDDGEYVENRNKADAEFIANAPADLRTLLDYVRELEAEVSAAWAFEDFPTKDECESFIAAARERAGLE